MAAEPNVETVEGNLNDYTGPTLLAHEAGNMIELFKWQAPPVEE